MRGYPDNRLQRTSLASHIEVNGGGPNGGGPQRDVDVSELEGNAKDGETLRRTCMGGMLETARRKATDEALEKLLLVA